MLMLIELKNKKKRRKKSSYCDLRNVLQRMKRKHVQSQKDMEIITKKKEKRKKENVVFIWVSLNRIWRWQFTNSQEVLLHIFTDLFTSFSVLFHFFLFLHMISRENKNLLKNSTPVHFVFYPTEILWEKDNNWKEEEEDIRYM